MNYSSLSVLSPRSFKIGECFFPIAFFKFSLLSLALRKEQRQQHKAGIPPLF